MTFDVSPGELVNKKGTNPQQPHISDAKRPEEPDGHNPPVQAPLPLVCHPLKTEKAWVLCSQITTISNSKGWPPLTSLGLFSSPEPPPLSAADSLRPREAGPEPAWCSYGEDV